MARSSFVSLACGMLCAASRGAALEVVSPSAGLSVVADRTYTVEWTGANSGRFEIDLYYCGSICLENDCGEWVTALCPYGETGCPDSAGDYDIIMPEPMGGTSGSGYKVRVMDVDDEASADCSDEFILIQSEDAPRANDVDGPFLDVTTPAEGDSAFAGNEYTVEWDYDNGFGSTTDRFKIDLYEADGDADCGTWVTSLCDTESIGCKDSMGDYDVVIPGDVDSGDYKIRVGLFDDDELYGCSGTFAIVADDDDDMSMSYRL